MAEKELAKQSARERLLTAADELFYREGVQTVGIERVISHAGVARASLYNTFGSKENLVSAYLERRGVNHNERINRTLTRFRSPRERLLGMFDALGEQFTEPEFNGCAFMMASAEAPRGSAVENATDNYRGSLRALFTTLAKEALVADPDGLARQLHILYDGATVSARLDRDPSAATTARASAATLFDAAPKVEKA